MTTAFQVLIDYACSAHGMAAVTLFLSDTYGEQDPRQKLVNLLCATARSRVPLPMSEGTQQVAPVHLDDVLDVLDAVPVAIELMLQAATKGTHARHFVVGAEVMSIRALVALFEQVTGHGLPILWGARPRLARIPETPFLGGERLPGWQPKVALADGLRRAMASAGDSPA